MAITPIMRGTNQTWVWTVLDEAGAPRPFQTGEWAKLCLGSLAPFGAEVLTKATNVSGEGSTTVGSASATFYLLPEDGVLLPASSYYFDIYLVLADGKRKKVGGSGNIQCIPRVCESP